MSDDAVVHKSCGECAKLRTPLCYRPDYCVGKRYSDFQQAKPWKKCEDCGGPMRRIRTRHPVKNVVITEITCADCGLEADDRREYMVRKRKGI